jgi:peptidoglycan/LPS O-acetylase OafA/YrhL
MKSQNINYVPKLDHLRFFAALLVMVYHFYYFQSGFYTNFKDPAIISKNIGSSIILEGHTGVALFLVLSGFIFSAIGFGRDIDYGRFIQNRLLRIMPLYALFVLIAAWLSAAPLSKIAASLLFLPPLAPGVRHDLIVPHLWTISVEFQFYLLFPFLVSFLARYGLKYALALISLVVALRCMVWLGPKDMAGIQGVSSTLLGRLDQFTIGMVAGAIYSGRSAFKRVEWLRNPLCLIFSCVLAVAVIYGFHRMGGRTHLGARSWVWVVWPTFEALGWASVVLTYTMCRFDWPSFISRGLAHLGTLSYSMYVSHWLFVNDMPLHNWIPQLSRSMTTHAAFACCLFVMPAVAAFSWLLYYVIERPFFELRKPYLREKIAAS